MRTGNPIDTMFLKGYDFIDVYWMTLKYGIIHIWVANPAEPSRTNWIKEYNRKGYEEMAIEVDLLRPK